jgi:hypothetical protein
LRRHISDKILSLIALILIDDKIRMAENKGYVSRGLLTVVAGITGIVPFIADWNETQ